MSRAPHPFGQLAAVLLSALTLNGATSLAAGAAAPPETPPPPASPDPLATLGIPVTGGAAPGYVPDATCAVCHRAVAESFAAVGMGRSFHRPTPARAIEDLAASSFAHAASRERYAIERRGDGRLVFRRWQLDAAGSPIHELEIPVDWVLGSGHHARTYLYRTPSGELWQLPVSWYAQTGRWGMAPGFDRADHAGVGRRVRRECLFCHNGYPDVPAGSDAAGAPQVFPAELPEGIGCQRCHGPGAEHARRAASGGETAVVRAAIVNPARLEPARRDDVCFGCHLQPAVAQPGVRRFGRGDYSFRPGEDLAGYLVQVDVEQEGGPHEERFEINHHPYRLLQSRCWRESAGRLSCLTCHDPHRKVAPAERAAHYRAACLSCHGPEACPVDPLTKRNGHGAAAGPGAGHAAAATGDCTVCHMPERRTQDVVQVTMTDHDIQRRPPPAAVLLAPRAEADPTLTDLRLFAPERAPPGQDGELYRVLAVVRAHGAAAPAAVDRLAALLGALQPPAVEPWLDLASAEADRGRWAAVERTLTTILARHPGQPQAPAWLGIARAALGRHDEAIALLRPAVERSPEDPATRFHLGRALLAAGRASEALPELERAVALRPNLAGARLLLGQTLEAAGRRDAAIEQYRQALAWEPRSTAGYLALARALLRSGATAEAGRYLRHGALVAADPEPLRAMLSAAER